jgi:hypothetical protein
VAESIIGFIDEHAPLQPGIGRGGGEE